MRIAIVDDQAPERTLLRGRLERALGRRSVLADFFEYENGEAFLDAARAERFSAAFLDVYMPGISGMEAARALRTFDPACLLIFATTSTDHALEGFQVRAMHYLVKPFTEEDVDRLVGEILARTPQADKYLDVKVGGGDIRLSYRHIVYAEHFSHLIHIHTPAKKTLATRMPFKDFTAPLREDPRFFVCGRGVIANLEHASDFEDGAFLMDEGSRVLVSRELTKAARQAFMEFLLKKGGCA